MKKEYFTPQADILRINAEMNFCGSGGLDNYDPLDPKDLDWE